MSSPPHDRSNLLTEQRLHESMGLDAMSTRDAVALFNQQNALAVEAVARESTAVAAAVELAVTALSSGGRLFYVGAGTSGRLGVLDAVECPPTFGADPSHVVGIIAGGEAAMFKSQEGAEDRAEDGALQMDRHAVAAHDLVVGIAAGGTTPFVHGALRRARERGARTIFLSCVQPVHNEPIVDLVIRTLTGPEIVTGSTRLKAGTAAKLVLNTLSTLTMVRLGKVHENLMVDLRASNAKLRDRAVRIVSTLARIDAKSAEALLAEAGGHVKLALLMHGRGLDAPAAGQLLAEKSGNLRAALHAGDIPPAKP